LNRYLATQNKFSDNVRFGSHPEILAVSISRRQYVRKLP
jgi:hypothetical protein